MVRDALDRVRTAAAAAVEAVDDGADRAFHHLRGKPAADAVFYTASRAAEFSLCWHVLSALGAATRPELRPHAARLTVALAAESILVNGMIKPVFRRGRPELIDGAPKLRRPRTASFPSGHASSAALAAVLLSDAEPRLRPVWWTMAVIVATSRIHTRMHHASDVAAGAVLGTALGVAVKRMHPLP